MEDRQSSDQDRVRVKYRNLARTYDRAIAGMGGRVAGFGSLRARAIEKLYLRPGDYVIDVGCGTGLSFGLIEERIGPAGQLVGIELSPDMLAVARDRVERRGWSNVTLVEGSVETAEIPMNADAALFCLVHDISRSRPAIENVLRHVKSGGRIVIVGGKALPRKAFPLGMISRAMLSRFVTTFDGIEWPWTVLGELVPNLRVEAKPLRLTYLAWACTSSEEMPSN